MSFFARLSKKYAWAMVFIWIVLTIPVAIGMTFLEVKSSQKDLIPEQLQPSQTIESVNILFAGIDYENIMVESDDLISYPMAKKFILLEESMREELGEESFIFVEHFLNPVINQMKQQAEENFGVDLDQVGGLSFLFTQEGQLVPNPLNEGEMVLFEELLMQGVNDLLQDPVAYKWLVEKEGSALLNTDMNKAMIKVKTPPDLTSGERNQLAKDMEGFFPAYFEEGEPEARVVISGEVSIAKDLEEYVYSSTWILAVLALLLLMALLYVTFQRLSDVLLPLIIIFISVLWIYGLMGWVGLPYTLISVVIGPIVLGINLGNLVYMMSRFYEELGVLRDQRKAADRAIVTVGVAIFLAAITTVFGFASFGFSDLGALKQFGFMAAVGVGVCFLMSVTFLPSLMILREDLRERRGKGRSPRGVAIFSKKSSSRLDRALGRASIMSGTHPGLILAVYGIVIFICFLGATRLTTTPDLRALAPTDLPSIEAQYEQEAVFGGQQQDVVLLTGDVLQPEALVAMHEFQMRMAESEYFKENNVSSVGELIHDYIQATQASPAEAEMPPEGEEDFAAYIPHDEEGVEAALDEVGDLFGSQEGKLVSKDHDAALITIFSGGAESTEELIGKNNAIKESAEASFDAVGLQLDYGIGGVTPISEELLGNLVPTQVWTAVLALILCGVVLVIIFRSFSYGLATLSVLVAGVAVEMGFIVLMGWKLDMMTVLIASMIIGMGVDYGIHVTHRFREEFIPGRDGVESALDISVRAVGKPLVASAISTAGAFLIIAFSKAAPIRRFGIITALCLGVSLVSSLVVLPSLLSLIARRKGREEEQAIGEMADYKPLEVEG